MNAFIKFFRSIGWKVVVVNDNAFMIERDGKYLNRNCIIDARTAHKLAKQTIRIMRENSAYSRKQYSRHFVVE